MASRALNGRRHQALLAGSTALLAGVLALTAGEASGAPGDLDPGFGGSSHGRVLFDLGGSGFLTDLAVQPGGGIITVGYRGSADVDAVVTRFHGDGRHDARFGVVRLPGRIDATEKAQSVVVQPDGKIVVAGSVTDSLSGLSSMAVWRLKPSGAIDTSFGTDGLVEVSGGVASVEAAFDVALDPTGKIVVAGVNVGVDADIAVVRLRSSGALDPTFNVGTPLTLGNPGLDVARAVAVQSDGKLVVAGSYAGVPGNAVLRITPGSSSAAAAPEFVAGVFGTLASNMTDVAVTPSGRILALMAVPSPSTPGATDASVVRLTSTGALDSSFGSGTGAVIDIPGTSTAPETLALLPHGGVVVTGSTSAEPFVAKVRSDGEPALGMGPGGVRRIKANGNAPAVATMPDGRIVVGGDTGGQNYLVRLVGDLVRPSCAGQKSTIVGTRTADRLVGTRRADVISGLGGGDTVTGLGRGDIVCGGPGNDHIRGGRGADRLYGQTGRDTLIGGPGPDTLSGGPGRDDVTP